jgi:hypothetical protein
MVSGMGIALAVYYGAWGRFFLCGSSHSLLSAPLWAIPFPLAFAPVALVVRQRTEQPRARA